MNIYLYVIQKQIKYIQSNQRSKEMVKITETSIVVDSFCTA